jgi:hypothetical protein
VLEAVVNGIAAEWQPQARDVYSSLFLGSEIEGRVRRVGRRLFRCLLDYLLAGRSWPFERPGALIGLNCKSVLALRLGCSMLVNSMPFEG